MLRILREEISYRFEIRGEGTTTSPINMLWSGSYAEDLHVLPNKKFLHVGKFATDTDPNAVLKLVSSKLKVDASSLTVVKLLKKDVDVTILKFVNLKLGMPDHLYDSVFKNDFWPNSVKVKRFIHRERAIVVSDGILSHLPEPGQTSTSSQPLKKPLAFDATVLFTASFY